MGKKHWIAMAGIRGCIPNFCQSCDTKADAIETLAFIHDDAPRGMKTELRKYHYTELVFGNEYASIEPCYCDEREVHDDQ